MNKNLKQTLHALLASAAVIVGGALTASGQTTLYTDTFDTDPSGFTRVLTPAIVDDFGEPSGSFAPGDVFGIVGQRESFAISDDTNPALPTFFETDVQGFVGIDEDELFLGFNDTVNGANPDPEGDVSVTWTFDVAGSSSLGLAFDIIAMGDFEGAANSFDPGAFDTFTFEASFDGGTAQTVVFGTGDDEGSLTYEPLFNDVVTTLDDPFILGAVDANGDIVNPFTATNIFQNVDFAIPGSGNSLELTLTVRTNGGGEAIGVDNLEILADFEDTGAPLTGDFDNDGDVDVDDIDAFSGNLGQAAAGGLAQLDLSGDGFVTFDDVQIHVEQHVMTDAGTGTAIGDVDLDGQVDVLNDAAAIVNSLGQSVSSWSQGDINKDGTVDVLGDAALLVQNLGFPNNATASVATSAVPEPGGIALLTLGAIGTGLRRKRS